MDQNTERKGKKQETKLILRVIKGGAIKSDPWNGGGIASKEVGYSPQKPLSHNTHLSVFKAPQASLFSLQLTPPHPKLVGKRSIFPASIKQPDHSQVSKPGSKPAQCKAY